MDAIIADVVIIDVIIVHVARTCVHKSNGGGYGPAGAALLGEVVGALLLAGQRHAVVLLVRPQLPARPARDHGSWLIMVVVVHIILNALYWFRTVYIPQRHAVVLLVRPQLPARPA
jgi:hypothetical protein